MSRKCIYSPRIRRVRERKFAMSHRCGVRRRVTLPALNLTFFLPLAEVSARIQIFSNLWWGAASTAGVSIGRRDQDPGTCFASPARPRAQERAAPFPRFAYERCYPGFVRFRSRRQLGKGCPGSRERSRREWLFFDSLGSDSLNPSLCLSSARNHNVLRHLEWLAPSQPCRISVAEGSPHEAPEMGDCAWTVLSLCVLVSDHCGSLRPSANASSLIALRRTSLQV